ncbi:MAG: MFS transporter [Anaerolinea sp.]
MFKNKALSSIFLIVFIDLLGFSLILPLLPYLAKSFSASEFQIGLLVASYALAQFIGAPFLGRLSDRYGRRPILLISIAGNALGFLLLGIAQNLTMLFVSRILAGFTAANISVAQAYISDVTDNQSRARGLGLIGAAFGLGFILGPAIGGALSQFGYEYPAFSATGLSIINFLLVFLWLKESLTPERRQSISLQQRPPLTLKAMLDTLRRPYVGPLLHTRFFFGLAFSLFQTIFAIYALERFNLQARDTGYILAYVGLISVLTQGVFIGKITKRFSEINLMFAAILTMAVSLMVWALAPSIPVLLVALLPIAISGGILNTVINSALSKSVAPVETGGILGLAASLESLTRVLAPSLGSLLLQIASKTYGNFIGTAVPGFLASILLLWLGSYFWRMVFHMRPLVQSSSSMD